MARERDPASWTSVAIARERMEHARPGGWWRRDLLLEILAAIYPRWITGAEMSALVAHVLGDKAQTRGRPRRNHPYGYARSNTVRSLSRLHGCRLVDRYGEPGKLKGRVKGEDMKRTWRAGGGYRYRLVRSAEDLL